MKKLFISIRRESNRPAACLKSTKDNPLTKTVPSNLIFSLDVREDAFDNSPVVKCPICNAKIPFSLPMHMMMSHSSGPNGKANEAFTSDEEESEPNAMPAMNRMRVASAQKGRRGKRRHNHKRRGRRS